MLFPQIFLFKIFWNSGGINQILPYGLLILVRFLKNPFSLFKLDNFYGSIFKSLTLSSVRSVLLLSPSVSFFICLFWFIVLLVLTFPLGSSVVYFFVDTFYFSIHFKTVTLLGTFYNCLQQFQHLHHLFFNMLVIFSHTN